MDKFLRLTELEEKVSLKRSTIYKRIDQGTFPKQISVGHGCVRWLESEVEAWMQRLIQESRANFKIMGTSGGNRENQSCS